MRQFATPVIEFYQHRPTFGTVDGLQSADKVTAAICAHIDGSQSFHLKAETTRLVVSLPPEGGNCTLGRLASA